MPLANEEMCSRLREIFRRPGSTTIPVGLTPWDGIMTERAGYEAFGLAGSLYHRQFLGWPDSGLVYPIEFAEHAGRVARAVNIPVILDADTAGGNPVNVYRSVKEFIWQGLAGCHIEDVQYPKGVVRGGQEAGRILHENALIVTREEAIGRFRAAVEARDELRSSFVIIARTDARNAIGGGLDEAISRANAYAETGVDVLMFDGFQTWDECKVAINAVKLPCFFTGTFFNTMRDAQGKEWLPEPTPEDRGRDGEKIYYAVMLGLRAADQAHWEMLVRFKQEGPDVLHQWREAQEQKPAAWRPPADLLQREKLWELQEKYLPKI